MKKEHVTLTDEERATLTALLAKGSLKARTFKRATGLLELDRGQSLQAVAQLLRSNSNTVASWRDSYITLGVFDRLELRLKGLLTSWARQTAARRKL